MQQRERREKKVIILRQRLLQFELEFQTVPSASLGKTWDTKVVILKVLLYYVIKRVVSPSLTMLA